MSTALPVILCGKSAQIATAVAASLKPEYEVLHVITSLAAGAREIPILLRGEVPAPMSETEGVNLGSRDYSRKAIAVIAGAGYDDAAIAEMRDACCCQQGATTTADDVPWLRPNLSKPTPPLGPAYAEAVVARVKVLLKEMADKGELDKAGVYFY